MTRTTARTSKPSKPKARPKPATTRAAKPAEQATSASTRIDQRIQDLDDWRGEILARMRALILRADPGITEEWKWEVPVWSHDGIVCTGEAYTKAVKLTFARGAALPDPARLFNASLGGNARRAIDIKQGEQVDAAAFMALVKAAVAENQRGKRKNGASEAKPENPRGKRKNGASEAKPVTLLSGGNPQIAKADGDAPVQAYIAAMPGWKRDVGKWLDAVIARHVPEAKKAVKWNSPFYGVEGRGWFVSFHTFTKYVKVTFFRGGSLTPLPPGESKTPEVRHFNIREGETLDEAQVARWVKQAAALPGWMP